MRKILSLFYQCNNITTLKYIKSSKTATLYSIGRMILSVVQFFIMKMLIRLSIDFITRCINSLLGPGSNMLTTIGRENRNETVKLLMHTFGTVLHVIYLMGTTVESRFIILWSWGKITLPALISSTDSFRGL
jgi:hypothetical protein